MVLDGKSSQEYPVNVRVLQGSILFLHFSYYTLMTFPMISIILLYMLILLCMCDRASDLWQQLAMSAKLESNLRDTGQRQEVAC